MRGAAGGAITQLGRLQRLRRLRPRGGARRAVAAQASGARGTERLGPQELPPALLPQLPQLPPMPPQLPPPTGTHPMPRHAQRCRGREERFRNFPGFVICCTALHPHASEGIPPLPRVRNHSPLAWRKNHISLEGMRARSVWTWLGLAAFGFIITLMLLTVVDLANADTPPPGVVGLKGASDGTHIGNVADALKVTGAVAVTGTISGAVAVTNFPSTQAVSAAALPLPAGASTSALQTSTISTLGSPFQAGGAIGNTSFGISGTLPSYASTPTFNLGALNGASTAANQVTAQASLTSIDSKLTSPLSVTGALTDAQLRASAVPVSAASLPLPSGAATSALQTTGNTSLASIDSKLTSPLTTNTTLQAGAAIIGKVGIDQTTPGTTNGVVVNSSALPAGGSTAANQATANTSLATIVTNTTGASTAANQATANTSLATIASNTTGVATAANQVTSNTNTGTTASNTTSILANQTNGTQKTQVTSIPADVAPATQTVTVQDTASTTTAVANGQNFITGTPTTGSAATFSVTSATSIETQVTGVWTGTIQTEISFDGGVTWITRGIKQSGASYLSSSFTQNFQGGSNAAGVTNYRVRATQAMTGTATVKVVATVNPASIVVSNPQTLRDATTQSVTNAIKPASTAAVATDNAFVVAVSPNNTPVLASNAATATNQATQITALGTLALQSGSNNNLNTRGSGTITGAGQFVTATANGTGTCVFQTTGTWSALLTLSGTVNGVASSALTPFSTAGAALSLFVTTNTTIVIPSGGFNTVSVGVFSYTSGTVNIGWECSSAPSTAFIGIATAAQASSVTVGSVSLGQTTGKLVVMKTGSLGTTATTANQVVLTYTVTAAKTLYLEYFDVSVILPVAAATSTIFGTISLSINGTIVYTQLLKGAGSTYNGTITLPEPINVAAGQVVSIITTPNAVTAMTWNGNFGGYEK